MPEISDFTTFRFYVDDDSRHEAKVEVDMDVEIMGGIEKTGMYARAMERIQEAMDREAQAIQDELDETGEVE